MDRILFLFICAYRDLCNCQPLIQDTGREVQVYLELFVRTDMRNSCFMENMRSPRPRIRCDNESIAAWVHHFCFSICF